MKDARIMAQNQNHLVWLDMEMTGLSPDNDRIIEIAMVVTDAQLETVAEAPVLVVHQSDSVLDGKSRGIFQGKIIVRPDAQKTDGKQSSHALLRGGGCRSKVPRS